MSYSSPAVVKARAGALGAAWSDTSTPGTAEIIMHLDTASKEIDGLLAAQGVSLPVDDTAAGMLEGPVADYALVLLIEGTWPGSISSPGISEALAGARARRDAWIRALLEGRTSIQVYVDSLVGSPAAADFWSTETTYPSDTDIADANANPNMQPQFFKGQQL